MSADQSEERMNAKAAEENGAAHEDYISKPELGRRLQMPLRTIEYWMWRGWLPYYKIGQAVRFKWSEVEQTLGRRHHHS